MSPSCATPLAVETPALPSDLTLCGVGPLREAGLRWLARPDDGPWLAVDAAAVLEVDAAGVQWLQALAHSLANRRRRLHLVAPSPALRSACAGLGFDALLDEPAGARP